MADKLRFAFFASFAMVLMVVAPCKAATSFNKAWYQCQRDTNCVVVEANCGLEWAANKKFAAKTRKYSPDIACTKPAEWHPRNTVAKCENHQCVLSPKGSHSPQNPAPE